ncbi:hypothetical protein [Salinibacter ruber]|uniref:hypothetical protein n=1 Tax=Salinibacter ruber TaxID=146919 RepID=UPI0021679884|nr:hypothetical protein [Salinibacter ruber]MCS4142763.1 hypothetical protein [Salinibacter ruber]
MHQTLCQHLPEELSKPQRRNLSWVITGLHQSGHVHFSKVASERFGSATLESKTRQVRRFFSNEHVDPQCCYKPVAELLLKQAITSGSPIRVLVDTPQAFRRAAGRDGGAGPQAAGLACMLAGAAPNGRKRR